MSIRLSISKSPREKSIVISSEKEGKKHAIIFR